MSRRLLPLLLSSMLALPAHSAEVEALVKFSHLSDITRGPPFNNSEESRTDYLGVGVTLTFKRTPSLELDLTHGRKAETNSAQRSFRFRTGTEATVRYYPGRHR